MLIQHTNGAYAMTIHSCDLTQDADGNPRLLHHTCQECCKRLVPQNQFSEAGLGLMAYSDCECGALVVTLFGEPSFVASLQMEIGVKTGCVPMVTHHFTPTGPTTMRAF